MSDKLQLEILKELREGQREITKALPTFATKEEHNALDLRFTSFSSKVKAIGYIGTIVLLIKTAWAYIV